MATEINVTVTAASLVEAALAAGSTVIERSNDRSILRDLASARRTGRTDAGQLFKSDQHRAIVVTAAAGMVVSAPYIGGTVTIDSGNARWRRALDRAV